MSHPGRSYLCKPSSAILGACGSPRPGGGLKDLLSWSAARMMIALHKQARTTPLIRAEIAASDEPLSALMQRYGVTAATVRKWRHRTVFHDRSHTARRLQTTLNPAQEAIVVYLR